MVLMRFVHIVCMRIACGVWSSRVVLSFDLVIVARVVLQFAPAAATAIARLSSVAYFFFASSSQAL